MLFLAISPFLVNLGLLLFLAICFVLILAVMIQKPQGGGLSAAFGASSGSGQTAFGTKTGDALTVATIMVFVVWLVVAVILNIISKPSAEGPAPAAQTPASAPAPAPVEETKKAPASGGAGTPATPPAGGNQPAPAVTPPAVTPPAATPPAGAGSPAAAPATPPVTPPPAQPQPEQPKPDQPK